MTFENLLLERDGAVVVITISRPQVLNALDTRTLSELDLALAELEADASVRVVIVTGAGEKSFVAGADIGELAALTTDQARAQAARGQAVFARLERLGKPVIAAINGFALGGGCELAMACTLRVAAEHARLGQPEINLGLIPGYGGTQRLPRLVGRGVALELLLSGRPITAAEALRVGLVNRVVPGAELQAEVRRLATELAAKAPLACRAIIDAVQHGLEMPGAEGQALEATLFGLTFATRDMREGVAAFLEKRSPTFRGQ